MGRFFLAYGTLLMAVYSNVVILDGSGTEPTAGAGKVGMTGEDFGEGGSGQENGKDILCGGGASSASVWVIDVGNEPPDVEVPQGFPPLGGM